MGQAKRRGTYEERKKQAIERDEKNHIEKIKKWLGITEKGK